METFTDVFGEPVTGDEETGWTRGGIVLGPCPQEQAETIFAGMAPDGWAPAEPAAVTETVIAPLAMMSRLTASEQTALASAAQSNAQIMLLMMRWAQATVVDTTDSQTIAGVNALEAAGLIAPGRAAVILDLSQVSP